MVISAVLARLPQCIHRTVCLDAVLPKSGHPPLAEFLLLSAPATTSSGVSRPYVPGAADDNRVLMIGE